jgi:hypothetical protein
MFPCCLEVHLADMVLFFYFNNDQTLLEFFRTQYCEFLNSVSSTILKMKPSFFRIFYFKFLKWNRSIFGKPTKPDRTGFPVFFKTDWFLTVFESMSSMPLNLELSVFTNRSLSGSTYLQKPWPRIWIGPSACVRSTLRSPATGSMLKNEQRRLPTLLLGVVAGLWSCSIRHLRARG